MEVAKEIGISQAQVSRIEKGALNQIKKICKNIKPPLLSKFSVLKF